MPHATHKARRIQTSDVPHAPVRRRRSRFEQQALLALAVGITMTAIVGLYAASFRSRYPVMRLASDTPRWSLLDEDLLDRAAPVYRDLSGVKASLLRLTSAGKTHADAAVILKAKVQERARAAASGTPETSEPPATPETP